jgi:hypothetical protein
MKRMTAAQKHRLMTKLLASKMGRRKIAASMQEPLRQIRDYVSVGRKAFFIDELPDGTLPIYDKDIETPAYVVGEEGNNIEKVVKGERILVPTFEMASNPEIPFTQVKERRFDIVRRVKEKVKTELFRREDQLIFAAMQAAGDANTDNPTVVVAAADWDGPSNGLSVLADSFANVEAQSLRVDKIFINPSKIPVFRKAGRDYIDFETQRELLRTGFIGSLYGASLFVSVEVPTDRLFLVTEPEYFGVMPIRIDLTVLPADDPKGRLFGWSVFQALGIGIHNVKGLQQIKITP